MKDIGSRFGINSYSSVGSVIIRIKLAMNKDKQLRQWVTAAEKLLTWAMKRPLRLTAQRLLGFIQPSAQSRNYEVLRVYR